MPVARCTQLECLEDHQLPRRVRQMIFTTQHVCDAHLGVIHRIAKEELRGAIRTPYHEVADIVREKALRPVHEVQKLDTSPQRDSEPRTRRNARQAPLASLLS